MQRLLRLSPQDNALTPQQRYNRERDVRVEFAMTYFGQLPPSWFQTQIAYAEFLDWLLARLGLGNVWSSGS